MLFHGWKSLSANVFPVYGNDFGKEFLRVFGNGISLIYRNVWQTLKVFIDNLNSIRFWFDKNYTILVQRATLWIFSIKKSTKFDDDTVNFLSLIECSCRKVD